jgi:hypothetical protein
MTLTNLQTLDTAIFAPVCNTAPPILLRDLKTLLPHLPRLESIGIEYEDPNNIYHYVKEAINTTDTHLQRLLVNAKYGRNGVETIVHLLSNWDDDAAKAATGKS